MRAISEPPRRPEHCTRTPWAPAFCTVWIARFMARRKLIRRCELVGDALRDQRRVELGLLDLLDVELHVGVVGDAAELAAEPVGLGAAAADDDARTGRVHVDPEPVAGALDLDAAHGRSLELGHQVVADLPVLDHRVLVVAVVEPARLPVGRDAEAEPVGIDLLAHQSLVSSSPAPGRASSAIFVLARRFVVLDRGVVCRPRRRVVVGVRLGGVVLVALVGVVGLVGVVARRPRSSSASLVGERLLDGLVDLGRLAGVARGHDLEELLVDRFAGSRRRPLRLWRHAAWRRRAGDAACAAIGCLGGDPGAAPGELGRRACATG